MGTPVSYTWMPSATRVVIQDSFGIAPRGSPPPSPSPATWAMKDPNDVLDYVFDLSEVLAGDPGDAIATVDVQVYPNASGDLVVQSVSADGEQVVLWLSQGQAGTTYSVTLSVGMNSGRVISRTVLLPVQSLGLQAPPGSPINADTGAAITDGSGNPLETN